MSQTGELAQKPSLIYKAYGIKGQLGDTECFEQHGVSLGGVVLCLLCEAGNSCSAETISASSGGKGLGNCSWASFEIVWIICTKLIYIFHLTFTIAMSGENRENTLFYSEIPKTINKAAVLLLSWKPLLDLFPVGPDFFLASRIWDLGFS